MAPVVSVDVLPADVPAEYAPAMVTACSEAMAEGTCALASTLFESTRPDAVALVLWQGVDYRQVIIRVGSGNGRWVQRTLTFSERDAISERFTTVGLTVATLVGETTPTPAPSPVMSPVVRTSSSGAAVVPARSPASVDASVAEGGRVSKPLLRGQLGGSIGPSWEGADWQRGGWVSVGSILPHTPLVLQAFASYSVSYGPSYRGVELDSSFLMGGIGIGLTGAWDAISTAGTASLEVAARRSRVERDARALRVTDWPVRLRLMGSYPSTGHVAFTGGAAVRLLPARDGATADADTLSGPPVEAELLAGVELRL